MKFSNLFIIMIFFCSTATYSQKNKVNNLKSCSNILNELSYYWKLDSLANNGFRLYTYQRLLNCKLDSINKTELLDKLGKSNKTSRTNHGTIYFYYFYDSKTIPKEKDNPFECRYISFLCEDKKNIITEVGVGVIDY